MSLYPKFDPALYLMPVSAVIPLPDSPGFFATDLNNLHLITGNSLAVKVIKRDFSGKPVKMVIPGIKALGILKFFNVFYKKKENFSAQAMFAKSDYYGNGKVFDLTQKIC